MIPKSLDKIEAADILALVANKVDEQRTIEFKRDRLGSSERDKMEFRADVTSFANSAGGDLIFGVEEAKGIAIAVPGLPDIDIDAERLRMESIIQSGIDPRIPGFETRKVLIPGHAPVIIVRIPKSWRGPHLVKVNEGFKMYGRTSVGKQTFDATEIRSAFTLSADLPERIRHWRDERIARILAEDTPCTLIPGARLVVHVVPLSAFASRQELAMGKLNQNLPHFPALCTGGGNSKVNLDGLLMHYPAHDGTGRFSGYCQAFRNGTVEGVSAQLVCEWNGGLIIPSPNVVGGMIACIIRYRQGLLACDVLPPYVVLTTMLGAKGARIAADASCGHSPPYVIDRDFVTLPEAVIESKDSNVSSDLRPVFDGLWNAGGEERCFLYDEHGKWAI